MSDHTLEHRIADAFASTFSSADLAKLLDEVKVGATDATKAKDDADRIAMDPATRPEAVREARSLSEDAAFRAARFTKAVEGLEGLHKDALKREADERALLEREAAISERDELAKDLAEWGTLTDKMVSLLTRLSRNNRRLGGPPTGVGMVNAEAIARGLDNMPVQAGFSISSIIEGTKLVSFNGSQKWPPNNRNNWVEYP